MLALIITIAVAVMTLIVCILSEHKEEIYEELNEKSNSIK
jgi:outer membrane lipoprotein-sorting protein